MMCEQWISVDERLPEMTPNYEGHPLTSGAVLVFTGSYVTQAEYAQTHKTRVSRWITWPVGRSICVTHWMPLPDPPSGLEEKRS